jgi:hypothetical protein
LQFFGKLTVLELARLDHFGGCDHARRPRNSGVKGELIEAAKAEGHALQVLEMGVADEASVNSAIDYVIKQHKRPRYVEYDLIGDEMMSILYQCHRNWRPQRNRMARPVGRARST